MARERMQRKGVNYLSDGTPVADQATFFRFNIPSFVDAYKPLLVKRKEHVEAGGLVSIDKTGGKANKKVWLCEEGLVRYFNNTFLLFKLVDCEHLGCFCFRRYGSCIRIM